MLKFLLDEHISKEVATGVRRRKSSIEITDIASLESGKYLGAPDELILYEAYRLGFTLVTYDVSTISPLVKSWAEQGIQHAGVIFIDDKTIPSSNFGQLIRALLDLWKTDHMHDWKSRTIFLARP